MRLRSRESLPTPPASVAGGMDTGRKKIANNKNQRNNFRLVQLSVPPVMVMTYVASDFFFNELTFDGENFKEAKYREPIFVIFPAW